MPEDLNSLNLLLVITTEKDYNQASNLSRELLRKKFAACISLRELKSLYWWEGKIEENLEVELIIKTSKYHLSNLLLEIKKMHSYDTPEILFWPINSSAKLM